MSAVAMLYRMTVSAVMPRILTTDEVLSFCRAACLDHKLLEPAPCNRISYSRPEARSTLILSASVEDPDETAASNVLVASFQRAVRQLGFDPNHLTILTEFDPPAKGVH